MVYSVGVTTNFEHFCAKIAYNSLKLALNFIKITEYVGHITLYMCTKFEENWSTRRPLLRDLKLFLFWCEEEEKYEENQTIFKNEYLANY